MKKLYFLIILLICVFLVGCITAKKVTKPRVDQATGGNAGYVFGKPHEKGKDVSCMDVEEREYIEIDVEIPIPSFPKYKEHYWEDDKTWGNKGYVSEDVTEDDIK